MEVKGKVKANSMDIVGGVKAGSIDIGIEGYSPNALVPDGTIIQWFQRTTDTPAPKGWAFCDGTNGTPDLRDRFIVGAGNDYTPGDTGGEKEHILTIDEMPTHRHDLKLYFLSSDTGPYFTYSNNYLTQPNSSTIRTSTESIQNNGNDQPHENRPPYYALAYIMKL